MPSQEDGRDLASWDDVLYFLTVARAGSLNAAARRLGVSHTTVGRHIRDFEGRLGTRLFERRDHRFDLTPQGLLTLPEAERMEESARAIQRRLAGSDGRLAGEVTLAISEGLAVFWLLPRLRPFQHAHPELRVCLKVNDTVVDCGRDIDIALQFNAPTEPYAVARKVAAIRFSIFATPAYEQCFGLPLTRLDLPRHRFIDHTGYRAIAALAPWTAMLAELPIVMRTDVTTSIQAAMNAGTGICLLPEYAPLIQADAIRAPIDLGLSADVWIVYHEDRRHVARVRALAAEIARLFEADRGTWFV